MTAKEFLEVANRGWQQLGFTSCRGNFEKPNLKQCCPLTAYAFGAGFVAIRNSDYMDFLFKSLGGVWVTGFYAGYDGWEYLQKKGENYLDGYNVGKQVWQIQQDAR